MKRMQLLLIALLLLIFCSPMYAAVVPDRAGIVTDSAGLFTSSQAKQIEDGLKGRSFEVFVLTARGLSESAVEQLGSDAYNSWKLGPKQLVLVVTAEPVYAHMVYDNEELAKAVSRTEAGNTKGIVDLNYVPLASKGKAAEGVIAVSNYVNSLQVSAPTGPTGQAPAPGTGGAPVGAIATAPGAASGTAPGGTPGTAPAPSGSAGGAAAGTPGSIAPAPAPGAEGTAPAGVARTSYGAPFSYVVVIGIVIVALIVAFVVRRLYVSRK